MGAWPYKSSLYCEAATDISKIAGSDWTAIPESDSGAALEAVPKVSKTLVAYLEGLLATAPYSQASDSCGLGLTDVQFKRYYGLYNTIA